ncbi:MAG TPA: hypothetical protein PLN86_04480 [Candidatus Hydrogenedentes bacterium]|nr:hypothetical protein [Candidatus Hydrogenedentota bacterium]
MAGTVPQRNSIHPIVRIILVSILILCGGSLGISIYWIFQKINRSAGVEIAEVVVAFVSIFIIVLFLVGLRTGLGLDRWIRYRRFEECRFLHSSKHTHRALTWLGYGHVVTEAAPEDDELKGWDLDELLALFEKPTRGGRRPNHPPERWIRVVMAWEKRDRLRNTMTLPEFLTQEFGERADGSPGESESTFYDYRRKIKEQIEKKARQK